jgi:bacterioferritin (cytochrome b1)
MQTPLTDNELWLLSFYRTSEISGALFFGRLAKSMSPGQVQHDMTRHFADESQHAWYWTACIEQLGAQPLVLSAAYQDQYLATAGLPANLMEVLALTQIFERRVIHQYARHSQVPNLHPAVKATLDKIMQDEKWHIDWVGKALKGMESEYGKAYIAATLARYREADQAVYQHLLHEHGERVQEVIRHQQHERAE